jgi:uncharacterized membrane protein YkvI
MNRIVRIYLIPGAIMQSVMIGGGYGTGREVIEYFTRHGIWEGILGICVAAVCIAIVFTLSLEISRVFQVFDYRNFFKVLLGPVWFLYEILGVLLFLLVVAVIGSAAGTIAQDEFGLHKYAGIGFMLTAVVILNFYGRAILTTVLAYWSIFLYLVFATYLVSVCVSYSDQIATSLSRPLGDSPWLQSGLQYSFYNITAIPIILYAARGIETRSEAVGAGVIGALLAVIPAMMLHITFASDYPAVLSAELPVYYIFNDLNMNWLKMLYLIVLFGTFIETGAGNIQGFIERLDGWRMEKAGIPFSRITHATVAGIAVILAAVLSSAGIISLIADGYGTLAWGFLAVYVVPLLTIGVYRIIKATTQT